MGASLATARRRYANRQVMLGQLRERAAAEQATAEFQLPVRDYSALLTAEEAAVDGGDFKRQLTREIELFSGSANAAGLPDRIALLWRLFEHSTPLAVDFDLTSSFLPDDAVEHRLRQRRAAAEDDAAAAAADGQRIGAGDGGGGEAVAGESALESLPQELLVLILQHVDYATLCRLACVSRRMAAACDDEWLWVRGANSIFRGLSADLLASAVDAFSGSGRRFFQSIWVDHFWTADRLPQFVSALPPAIAEVVPPTEPRAAPLPPEKRIRSGPYATPESTYRLRLAYAVGKEAEPQEDHPPEAAAAAAAAAMMVPTGVHEATAVAWELQDQRLRWASGLYVKLNSRHPNLLRRPRVLVEMQQHGSLPVAEIDEVAMAHPAVHLSQLLSLAPLLPLSERLVAGIVRQVLRAVEYLAVMGRIHNSVSLESLWLAADGTVLLDGLEAAMQLTVDTPLSAVLPPVCVEWSAPELLSGQLFGPKADIWAVGMLARTLLVGRPLFDRQLFGPIDAVAILGRLTSAPEDNLLLLQLDLEVDEEDVHEYDDDYGGDYDGSHYDPAEFAAAAEIYNAPERTAAATTTTTTAAAAATTTTMSTSATPATSAAALLPPRAENYSEKALSFVADACQRFQRGRPAAGVLMQHPFIHRSAAAPKKELAELYLRMSDLLGSSAIRLG